MKTKTMKKSVITLSCSVDDSAGNTVYTADGFG